ncbi:MAG: CoA-binding protein [Bacteriovoracaceae bacterium]
MQKENVVILGASDNSSRYSYMAMKLLEQHGHKAILVHPRIKEVEGRKVYENLEKAKSQNPKVDTLTMYVNPELSNKMMAEILELKPSRVIFNPGTENESLYEALDKAGIRYEEACTLVLLRTGQY